MYHKNWWNNSRYAEDLDLNMPKYNLIEYSLNYSETTGSLWFYSKDEATNFNNIENLDNSEVSNLRSQIIIYYYVIIQGFKL